MDEVQAAIDECLALSPEELVAEHTGRIEWAKRDEWVAKMPQGEVAGPTWKLIQLAGIADEINDLAPDLGDRMRALLGLVA